MFIKNHFFLPTFHFIPFLMTIILGVIGIFCIFSATTSHTVMYTIFFKKQCIGLLSGILIYFICIKINYQTLLRWGFIGYFFVLAILFFTLLKGHIGMGAQRWITIGVCKIQPSELVKLFLPLHTTFYFHNYIHGNKKCFTPWIPFLFLLCINFLLILKQPDLGTALVIVISGLTMAWIAGISTHVFTYMALIISFASPIIWHNMLKPYQKKRIIVFLGGGTQKNERYQIEQSNIAIGSGGICGKGFLRGTQNTLRFLPEGRTDFIFSVFSEEFGLLGAIFILLCYFILFFSILSKAQQLQSISLTICTIGLITPIILATFINIGMVINLLPVVGMPLPLMSYGISNLWITLASLGVIQNITRLEKKYL